MRPGRADSIASANPYGESGPDSDALGSAGVLLGTGPTSCRTRGGYSDFGVGMQATIRDPGGTVIGIATCAAEGVSTATEPGPIGPIPTECTFTTVAGNVPDATFYGIEVGRRGTVQFSRDELAANAWAADLSPGQLRRPRFRGRSARGGCRGSYGL